MEAALVFILPPVLVMMISGSVISAVISSPMERQNPQNPQPTIPKTEAEIEIRERPKKFFMICITVICAMFLVFFIGTGIEMIYERRR
jgi:uncharacterized membrane protein SpoIIM required for sporulation